MDFSDLPPRLLVSLYCDYLCLNEDVELNIDSEGKFFKYEKIKKEDRKKKETGEEVEGELSLFEKKAKKYKKVIIDDSKLIKMMYFYFKKDKFRNAHEICPDFSLYGERYVGETTYSNEPITQAPQNVVFPIPKKVEIICLSSVKFCSKNVPKIDTFFKLKDLTFRSVECTDETGFSSLIFTSEKLKSLSLNSCNPTSSQVKNIFEGKKFKGVINNLDIGGRRSRGGTKSEIVDSHFSGFNLKVKILSFDGMKSITDKAFENFQDGEEFDYVEEIRFGSWYSGSNQTITALSLGYLFKSKSLKHLSCSEIGASINIEKVKPYPNYVLKELYISRAYSCGGITVDMIKYIRDNLKVLEKLGLYENDIDDEPVEYIAQIKTLKWLSLDYNMTTPKCIDWLCKHDNIEYLNLSGIGADFSPEKFGDEHFKKLMTMKSLKDLNVDLTQITDKVIPFIKEGMEILNVAHTLLTKEGIEKIKQLKSIKRISFCTDKVGHGMREWWEKGK